MPQSQISVVFVIKNGIKMGYCFWESLQSILPLANELIISDGYSNDGTYEAIVKFKEKYCKDAILYQDEWEETSYHGEVISKVTQRAINKATKEWIMYVQADEVYDDLTIEYIKRIISEQYNSISLPYYHFNKQLKPSAEGYRDAIRIIRGSKNAKLVGDGWTFESVPPICPSNLCPKPVYHFNWIFPKNNDIKDIEHSKIYINYPCYQENMKRALKSINKDKPPYPKTDFDDFPALARRFIGQVEYTLPEDL